MSALIHAAGVLAAVREVVPARAQMATTLGFHIILACFGIAFPTIVLFAEYIGLKRSDEVAMTLARRWSQALGVLVAVGAVTGTVLSFEMGLLWPGLMRKYGAVIGFPFSVEGIFFFLEAIFTGIYLYGWRRLRGWAHFWSGIPVAVSGILGAISVMAANSWMNQPGGFTLRGGRVVAVDALQVFFNRAAIYEMPHMVLAAYLVAGFGVASVYAAGFLRGRRDRYHRLGFGIPFVLAAVLTPFQIFVGDTAARAIATDQPVKFAAMEYVTHTSRGVPEYLGGVYSGGHVYFGLSIPDMDSLLVGFSPHTKVVGWDSVAPVDRPPAPTLIHLSFDAMVGLAFLLLLAGLWALVVWRRERALPSSQMFLVAGRGVRTGGAGGDGVRLDRHRGRPPAVGRLPAAHDRAGGDDEPGCDREPDGVIVLYAVLGVATVVILRLLARRWHAGEEEDELRPLRAAHPPPDAAAAGRARDQRSRWRDPARGPDPLRDLRGRGLRRRPVGPARRRRRARPGAAAADRRDDHAGVGGQPRVAHLRPRHLLDRIPDGLRRRDDRSRAAAVAGSLRDRAARRRLRVSQGGSRVCAPNAYSAQHSRSPRC